MKLNKITIAIAAGAVALSATIAQADVKPAVVYDKAGKFDKSFNEAVWNGVKRFTADTGISVREVEPTNEAQVEQGLKKLAKRGNSPIVAVGFSSANALSAAAQAYPDTKFTLIDMVVPEANVQNVVFKEHEGSFLVGALAALKSETGTIGFVGGMDIPLISRFGCGYEQGAKHINANITVLQKMTGSTPAAWGNPSKGGEITRSQIEAGADVIFAAAGGTGMGVYQAAADAGKLAIGVDSNQNHLQPGTMLTSMVKRVGVAAYKSYADAKDGTWSAGVTAMGLAEGGVDWALDEHNRSLVTADMETKVNAIKASIIAGDIAVHDYMSDNTCNY
ncbi:MAG: BMP family ABC transporter substrate-binding protein [Gammaproteobacteria bacterium]|jgi:basic membrane protein A|uniref:BMP family lipoprotein n=1 Tax=Candidatus Njordibacter sp. Uisw_058 TaxID=3230974 RepID=UPI000E9439ED|nr:BMP family ABC transporter substrate-binding protein [Oceanospirillaceae bacterium]MDA9279654.1 BMP family ABC transporter substrate-binding protein [bacterium]CAI8368624.1 MAG: Membrane lipoprotein TmpC [Oceanospirillaceae bacterium UBA2001]MBT5630949.1 BMP family ABC transporter substrate-binding protein [Oceanospirillaceae bacterium]MBT6099901.1 BMP family ABC transporter substrate-binding protein [Oceanospirillaceae bacterium]|tara:strand:+ start:1682 stop:2683 length:1002 start_codon:yes stop_codon:yes gene_type:complete